MNIQESLSYGMKNLTNTTTPSLDVNIILSHILLCDKSYLLSHREMVLPRLLSLKFMRCIDERNKGLPIAYITNKKEFYGIEFYVNKNVLIPKPDTELLVEKAIEFIKSKNENDKIDIADICTGSGCVGISIVSNIKNDFSLVLSDISMKALNVAKKNISNIIPATNQKNISIAYGDLLDAIRNKNEFDLIVSNPPYVPSSEVNELLKDGRSEPRVALDGDNDIATKNNTSQDGMSIIKRLVKQAYNHLKVGGAFLVESGEYNASKTYEAMKEIGFSEIKTYNDLSNMPRVTMGLKS